MKVAKYWRNNSLRYRMEGVVQNKIRLTEPACVEVDDTSQQIAEGVVLGTVIEELSQEKASQLEVEFSTTRRKECL